MINLLRWARMQTQDTEATITLCVSLHLLNVYRLQQQHCSHSKRSTHQLMQEPMKKRAAAYLLKLAPAAFMGIS